MEEQNNNEAPFIVQLIFVCAIGAALWMIGNRVYNDYNAPKTQVLRILEERQDIGEELAEAIADDIEEGNWSGFDCRLTGSIIKETNGYKIFADSDGDVFMDNIAGMKAADEEFQAEYDRKIKHCKDTTNEKLCRSSIREALLIYYSNVSPRRVRFHTTTDAEEIIADAVNMYKVRFLEENPTKCGNKDRSTLKELLDKD